ARFEPLNHQSVSTPIHRDGGLGRSRNGQPHLRTDAVKLPHHVVCWHSKRKGDDRHGSPGEQFQLRRKLVVVEVRLTDREAAVACPPPDLLDVWGVASRIGWLRRR